MRFVFEVPGIVLAQFTVVSALSVRLNEIGPLTVSIPVMNRSDGRSDAARCPFFFRVILPLARNGLIASCILTWARAVGEFGGNNHPGGGD